MRTNIREQTDPATTYCGLIRRKENGGAIMSKIVREGAIGTKGGGVVVQEIQINRSSQHRLILVKEDGLKGIFPVKGIIKGASV